MKYILVLLSVCLSAFALVGCKSEDPLTNPLSNEELDAQMDQEMRDNGIDEETMDDMMADEIMGNDDMMDDDMENGTMDDDMAMEEVTFDISGGNFYFSEETLEVKKGTKVTINFVSDDGFHDWVVDEFNAATEKVQTGGTTSVTFVADQAGSFEYYCSVGKHRENGMVGTLTVTE